MVTTITRDLAPSLATARRLVVASTRSLIACWRIDILGLLRIASLKLLRSTSLSTTACMSVDTFANGHALLDRIDGVRIPTRFAISLSLCPAQRSAETFTRLSLRSHFEIHTNNKPCSSMSQS